ncbi:hypothetical protein EB796_019093 [Bugula neritina]|uniref:Uncharacterized protein n=1 Tax=Bugula neritina TaxID=10212 RepID=A0A7J7JB54_BUGNE|nr:hypothetical protein EB796_019093 [Bugula neritina]
MMGDLDEKEEQIAKEFLEEINAIRRQSNSSPISWKDAVKFCMARKFDKERAIELQKNHSEVWVRERLININPCREDVRKELVSGKLTILDSRDANGAAIALFTARFHNPLASSRNVTLQSLVYQLDAALDSVETQRNGLVFVYDMTDSKFSNFDYELSAKILDLLKGSFPAKLKKVLIVLAPLWFKAPFKILRLFLKEKLQERVYTVDDIEILQHIAATSLPTHLGGVHTVDHMSWLQRCLLLQRVPDPAMQAFFDKAEPPNYITSKFAAHAANVAAMIGVNKTSHDANHHSHNAHTAPPSNPPSSPPPPSFRAPDTPPPAVPERFADEIPDILSLPPSWKDADPTESVFPSAIENMMTAGEQLQAACTLGKRGLVSEYMKIKSLAHPHSFVNSRLPINGGKNRYSDVLCSDYTRVILDTDSKDAGDYINANHVNSYRQKRGLHLLSGTSS